MANGRARPRILWSSSHYEFVLSDDYYFSRLRALLEERADVVESGHPLDLDWLREFDTVVFNYPERPFSTKEVRKVHRFVRGGGRVVVSAYYQNEDGVAEVATRLAAPFGIAFGTDRVERPGEGLLVRARTTGAAGVPAGLRVLLPCSCSLSLAGGAKAVAVAGRTPVVAAAGEGSGLFVALGTSVFWDNFSLGELDNERFALAILGLRE